MPNAIIRLNKSDREVYLGLKGHKDFVVIVSTRVNDSVKILAVLPNRKKNR